MRTNSVLTPSKVRYIALHLEQIPSSVKMAETLTKRESGRAALPFGTLFAF